MSSHHSFEKREYFQDDISVNLTEVQLNLGLPLIVQYRTKQQQIRTNKKQSRPPYYTTKFVSFPSLNRAGAGA